MTDKFLPATAQLTLNTTEDGDVAFTFDFNPPISGKEEVESLPATHKIMSNIIADSIMPMFAEQSAKQDTTLEQLGLDFSEPVTTLH